MLFKKHKKIKFHSLHYPLLSLGWVPILLGSLIPCSATPVAQVIPHLTVSPLDCQGQGANQTFAWDLRTWDGAWYTALRSH